MNTHTPEPWRIRNGEHNRSSTSVVATDNWPTAETCGSDLVEARANAERIVACINFCAGARSEVLKPGLLVISFRPLADGTCVDVLTLNEDNRRLKAENARLKAGQFTADEFQNLCHKPATNLNRAQSFCDGCEEYHKKLFGWSPITSLKDRVKELEEMQPTPLVEFPKRPATSLEIGLINRVKELEEMVAGLRQEIALMRQREIDR